MKIDTDSRAGLQNQILSLPGMECHITTEVGRGSNAIVYRGWYQDQLHKQEQHQILIKELFPLHPEGLIYRGEDNRICVEGKEAAAFFGMHRESFVGGNRIHLKLLANAPDSLGANLNSYEKNDTLYTVLGYTGGRDLAEELAQPTVAPSLRRYAQLTIKLLDALEVFHRNDHLHLDISPDNILLFGTPNNERIMLIDYNSACRTGDSELSYTSIKEGYSAPETELGDQDMICEASDLYSVTAVFFRCLMGRTLTLEETLEFSPPDAHESPFLTDAPQTVQWQVRHIMRSGLAPDTEDRYTSITDMRTALNELLDRIDCVGVTHWALWEAGRRSLNDLIRSNPALQFMLDDEEMYPIRLEHRGLSKTLPAFLEELLSEAGASTLAVSEGGAGKTTLLMRTALTQNRIYAQNRPAAFYVSLNGWHAGDERYIRSQLLMQLHFKRETATFQNAVHELELLLSRPLRSSGSRVPALLLLLDGLNEARDDLRPLYEEIRSLAGLQGVRILAVSRGDAPELALETCRLQPLLPDDVTAAAAAKGVLLPQSNAILDLLRTPLILSIYLKASENYQQLYIRSRSDLIQAYLESLYEKELDSVPGNAPEHWQTDAALHYVLPAIAAKTVRAGRALSDSELLRVVTKCYRNLASRTMHKAFPRWIGHRKDIFGGASGPEEWYGLIVHDLLWQRLGVLIRDEQNCYRIFHQMVGEELALLNRKNRKALTLRKLPGLAACAALALALGAGVWGLVWKPYVQPVVGQVFVSSQQKDDVQELLELAMARCQVAEQTCEDFGTLLDYLLNGDELQRQLLPSQAEELLKRLKKQAEDKEPISPYLLMKLEACAEKGYSMPWSRAALPAEELETIARMPSELAREYSRYLEILLWLQGSDYYAADGPEYIGYLQSLIQADLEWVRTAHARAVLTELKPMAEKDPERYEEVSRIYPDTLSEPDNAEATLFDLQKQREACLTELDNSDVVVRYEDDIQDKE